MNAYKRHTQSYFWDNNNLKHHSKYDNYNGSDVLSVVAFMRIMLSSRLSFPTHCLLIYLFFNLSKLVQVNSTGTTRKLRFFWVSYFNNGLPSSLQWKYFTAITFCTYLRRVVYNIYSDLVIIIKRMLIIMFRWVLVLVLISI